jgi:hypothetical protein
VVCGLDGLEERPGMQRFQAFSGRCARLTACLLRLRVWRRDGTHTDRRLPSTGKTSPQPVPPFHADITMCRASDTSLQYTGSIRYHCNDIVDLTSCLAEQSVLTIVNRTSTRELLPVPTLATADNLLLSILAPGTPA